MSGVVLGQPTLELRGALGLEYRLKGHHEQRLRLEDAVNGRACPRRELLVRPRVRIYGPTDGDTPGPFHKGREDRLGEQFLPRAVVIVHGGEIGSRGGCQVTNTRACVAALGD